MNNIIGSFSNSGIAKKYIDYAISSDSALARAGVVSGVAKDAIAYAVRFNQTRNNKEIPEDKRKFVAAMDFSSGFTTCAVQLILGFGISSKKIQDKLCSRLFDKIQDIEIRKMAKAGFIAGLSLFVAGVIGERMIVPLIASQVASKIKNKLDPDSKAKAQAEAPKQVQQTAPQTAQAQGLKNEQTNNTSLLKSLLA